MPKRGLFYILLLFVLLVTVACRDGGEPVAESTDSPPADPTPTLAPELPTPTLPPPVIDGGEGGEGGAASDPPMEEAPPVEVEEAIFPWPADRFGYGTQAHAVVGDPAVTMTVVDDQLGLQWVKVQMEWPIVEPDPGVYQWFFYDGAVDEAAKQGLNLMFSVVGAPAWTRAAGGENGPPDDLANYTNFLQEMLTRYAGKVHAVEIWNEQNLDREWATPTGLSPAGYVELLRRSYETVKAIDPNIIVISGALSPTGVHDGVKSYDDFIYMDEALAAGMLDYADCVGAHHNGYNIGPDVAWDATGSLPEAATAIFRGPFDNPHHAWSFKTTIDTYAEKVQAIKPDMKVCVTEFGWASNEGYEGYPDNFSFVQDNTLEEQAQFIVQAFQLMRDSGNVWLAFQFNFDFGNKGNGPTDDPVPYSLVDLNGAPRPAFTAVSEMEKTP